MDIISQLPIEIKMIIFRRLVGLNAIKKDMKAELQNKWFILFLKKARKLHEDCQYYQCSDTILTEIKNCACP